MLAEFPEYLRDHPGIVIGCPDCHDQGGFHIEVKHDDVIERWQIDTDEETQPEEIKDYIKKLADILGQLKL